MSEAPDQGRLLTACRAQLQQEGSQSSAAHYLFQQFYESCYQSVSAWIWGKPLTGMADGDDLLIATFWKAWQWIGGQADLPAPEILLRVCLDRAYTDHLRSEYGRRSGDSTLALDATATSRQPLSLDRLVAETPALIEALADDRDVAAMVVDAESVREHLSALPPAVRACVQCRHLYRWSVAETAQQLDLTSDQVKKYTAYGLTCLAQRMVQGAIYG